MMPPILLVLDITWWLMVATQYSKLQSNNPNAPEQNQVVGVLQRVSVSGDWER
jgi:hypothetical protein